MTTAQIRHFASAVTLGVVVAVLVDVALHGIVLSPPPSAGRPVRGLMLAMIMGRLTWAALAALSWVAAPLLSRILQRGAVAERHALARVDAFKTAGQVMLVFPILWIVATWLVGAVKITVVGSWSTEGQVFITGYYYRNLLIGNFPWFIGGFVLLAASRWMNGESTAA